MRPRLLCTCTDFFPVLFFIYISAHRPVLLAGELLAEKVGGKSGLYLKVKCLLIGH